jgi:ribosomal protein S18 acetylase RimI-like enzyme
MDIRLAAPEDLPAIAALHKETFKGLFSGELSKTCLIKYYQSLLSNDDCRVWVIGEDKVFAGFIAGCSAGYYVPFTLQIEMLADIFKKFYLFEIIRLLKKRLHYIRLGVTAELIAIAVLDKYRGRGFGTSLLRALEGYFVENKITRYRVFTDLKHSKGIEFYLARKFKEIKKIKLLGYKGIFLQKEL